MEDAVGLAVRVRGSRPDDAGLIGQDHGLDPVAEPELGQQVPDVRLHRGFADEQVGSYLRVGEPAVMPGPADGGGDAAYLGQFFTSVRAVATLSNPYGLHNQEWHGHVYLCTGPRHPWGQMWPQLRQYS